MSRIIFIYCIINIIKITESEEFLNCTANIMRSNYNTKVKKNINIYY